MMCYCIDLSHQFLAVQTPVLYTEYWHAHMPSSDEKMNDLQVHEVQNEFFEVIASQKREMTANWRIDIGLIPVLSPVTLKMSYYMW